MQDVINKSICFEYLKALHCLILTILYQTTLMNHLAQPYTLNPILNFLRYLSRREQRVAKNN